MENCDQNGVDSVPTPVRFLGRSEKYTEEVFVVGDISQAGYSYGGILKSSREVIARA